MVPMFRRKTVSQNILLWTESTHRESVTWVEGIVHIPQNDQHEVKSPSVRDIEVKIDKVRFTPSVASMGNSLCLGYMSCLPKTLCYRFRLWNAHRPHVRLPTVECEYGENEKRHLCTESETEKTLV